MHDQITMLFEELNYSYKIPGLRHPYFTKLFYFMGQIAPSPVLGTPLIFDKWLTNAYCALSIQAYPKDNIREFFPGIKKSLRKRSIVGEIQCATGGKLAKLYERFLKDFDNWSRELGVSSHKLEEFVFGLELKSPKNRTKENPRVALWNIISDHYNWKDGAKPKPITLKNLPLTRIGKPEMTNQLPACCVNAPVRKLGLVSGMIMPELLFYPCMIRLYSKCQEGNNLT